MKMHQVRYGGDVSKGFRWPLNVAGCGQGGKLAAKIQQRAFTRLGQHDVVHRHRKQPMRACVVCVGNLAVQVRQCARQLPLAVVLRPIVPCKPHFGRKLGQARKIFGRQLLVFGKHVQTQTLVGAQWHKDFGVQVHGQDDGRRAVGQRHDGGHGHGKSPQFAIGGNQVDAVGAGGHGFAKLQGKGGNGFGHGVVSCVRFSAGSKCCVMGVENRDDVGVVDGDFWFEMAIKQRVGVFGIVICRACVKAT